MVDLTGNGPFFTDDRTDLEDYDYCGADTLPCDEEPSEDLTPSLESTLQEIADIKNADSAQSYIFNKLETALLKTQRILDSNQQNLNNIKKVLDTLTDESDCSTCCEVSPNTCSFSCS